MSALQDSMRPRSGLAAAGDGVELAVSWAWLGAGQRNLQVGSLVLA